jgi:uncharacterized protein with PIN domain
MRESDWSSDVCSSDLNTLLHYGEFWLCPNCGSVYWQGAHWTKIKQTLQKAKEQKEKEA